jgi:thiosulfate dehydrogenase [quinone] large subunit
MEYTNKQLTALVILRVLIGGHLLYEGLVKLLNPYWTAAEYLQQSQWIFSSLFHWIADNAAILTLVDVINTWGLILIGAGLIAGLFTRAVCISAITLLLAYYLAHPPLIGLNSILPMEGNYLIINKNLVEIAALYVLYLFPTGHLIGLDRLIKLTRKKE